MKIFLAFLMLCCTITIIAQDDDFCICMLDQPAYEASTDNSNLTVENPYAELFTPQLTLEPSEDSRPLMLLLEEDIDDREDLDEEEQELEAIKSKRPASRKRIKTKNKARVPRWNPKKKPKKYKGQCPFF